MAYVKYDDWVNDSAPGISATRLAHMETQYEEAAADLATHIDTDTAPTAIHHTLGTGANQAAAGNHNHALDEEWAAAAISHAAAATDTWYTEREIVAGNETIIVWIQAQLGTTVDRTVSGRILVDDVEKLLATVYHATSGLVYGATVHYKGASGTVKHQLKTSLGVDTIYGRSGMYSLGIT